MTYNLSKELNPLFEIIGLLMMAGRQEKVKEEIVVSLSGLGFDGEDFYKKYFKVYDKYVTEFNKNCIVDDDHSFFFEAEDGNFVLIYTALILDNQEELSLIDSYQDIQINEEIIRICNALYDMDTPVEAASDLETLITFLDHTQLSKSERWKMLRFMQSPKSYIKKLIKIIYNNMKAYEIAKNKVAVQLKDLIAQLSSTIQKHSSFHKIKDSLCENGEIYPTLVLPMTLYVFEQECFYGVYNPLVISTNEHFHSKEYLLQCLKAISDKSKLDILCSLKESPKYNLEIAQQMGLTAATMSHHMNSLLSSGLITVNKQNSKVYYNLDKEAIKNVIDLLNKRLLK